ncbi:MAG TPA: DUF6585 family protein [Ktedonobacterales bacterium]|nr:DUF6585 family protein [Ktedonobacterales bacterium]
MAQQARVSSQPPLPQEAYQYAGMYHLGNPVAVYRVSFRNSIVLGILCLPFAMLFAYVALTDESSSISIALLLLMALLCAVGAVYYLVFYPLIHGSWRIYACTDGFVFLKGSTALPFRWDQVAFVWQRITRNYTNGVYTGTTFRYMVQRVDNVEVRITQQFRNGMQLGTQIQREATNRLTPAALAAVNAGQTLQFGPFSVSRQGLGTSRGMIPWNEVQQVSANRGIVVIQQRGQRKGKTYGMVYKVPNMYVFFNVANAIAKGR